MSHRHRRRMRLAAALAVCALALSACSNPEQAATTPGTTPSVWTGSPSPSSSSVRAPQRAAATQPHPGARYRLGEAVARGVGEHRDDGVAAGRGVVGSEDDGLT